MTELERRIARLEQLANQARHQAERVESGLSNMSQLFFLGTSWVHDPGLFSCAYDDWPETLLWTFTGSVPSGVVAARTITKTDNLGDTLGFFPNVRGWIGAADSLPLPGGARIPAYRFVYVDETGGAYDGQFFPTYTKKPPGIGEPVYFDYTRICKSFSMRTVAYGSYSAATIQPFRDQPGPRAAPPPPPGPDFDPRRFD